jgi:hypothetical protein
MLTQSTFTQRHPGWLHLIADGWTSPNIIAFIGAMITLILNGKITSIILDFTKYVIFSYSFELFQALTQHLS